MIHDHTLINKELKCVRACGRTCACGKVGCEWVRDLDAIVRAKCVRAEVLGRSHPHTCDHTFKRIFQRKAGCFFKKIQGSMFEFFVSSSSLLKDIIFPHGYREYKNVVFFCLLNLLKTSKC